MTVRHPGGSGAARRSARRCGTCANSVTVYPQDGPLAGSGESHEVCEAPGGPMHVVPDGPFWPNCRFWRRR